MRKPYLKGGDTQRSGPHRRVEGFLKDLNINFESEVYFAPYTADIYLPEWHIIIEIDGPQHSRNKDRVRDNWLEIEYGLRTLRVNAKVWILQALVTDHIVKFIEEHADTTAQRKSDARQRP